MHLERQHETDVPPDNWTFDFTVIEKNSGVYQIIAGYAKPWYDARTHARAPPLENRNFTAISHRHKSRGFLFCLQ